MNNRTVEYIYHGESQYLSGDKVPAWLDDAIDATMPHLSPTRKATLVCGNLPGSTLTFGESPPCNPGYRVTIFR